MTAPAREQAIDLDELERLDREATPRPWDGTISAGCIRYLGGPKGRLEHGDYIAMFHGCFDANNAYLIADLRNALPSLIAAARRAMILERALNDNLIHEGGCSWYRHVDGPCTCGAVERAIEDYYE